MIYFDMDGVLCNFRKAAKELDPDIWKIENRDVEEFWGIISKRGVGFWRDMDPIMDGVRLHHEVTKFTNEISVLTAYPDSENLKLSCYAKKGKTEWIQKYNIYNQQFICIPITAKKYYAEGNILIDDYKKNIKEWNNEGGTGILFRDFEQSFYELQEVLK